MSDRPALLVTGGAKRLGAAIAARFADEGWHVVIHCNRSVADGLALAASLPSAEVVTADLADPSACAAMVEDVAAGTSDWRLLVNCAGIFEPDDGSALDPVAFERAMAVNARAPALLAQAYFRTARAVAGRCVIQVTDQKIANPNPDFFSYSMSKHALAATVPMLAKAWPAPEDRTYGLAPGAILASHDQDEAEIEVSHRLNLLDRKTAAREIADAALFLSSRALASGQTLFVDSGQWLLDQPRDVIFLARDSAHSR